MPRWSDILLNRPHNSLVIGDTNLVVLLTTYGLYLITTMCNCDIDAIAGCVVPDDDDDDDVDDDDTTYL